MKFDFADKAPLVVVEARLNNKGPFKFVVDTASSVTVVEWKTAEVVGIRANSSPVASGCCSSKMSVVNSLQIGEISKSKVPVVLGDLSKLSEETGTRLDGIVGSPFLTNYEVVIDYQHKEIAFQDPRKEQRLPVKFKLVSNVNFIVVETRINGKGPFNFLVDTGATKTVVTNHIGQTFDLHEISSGKKKALSGSFAGTTMTMSKIQSIQVGKAKSADVEVGVQDLLSLCTGIGAPLDGILGYTFMKDYRVTINYPERKLSFQREETTEIDGNA